MAKIIYGLSGQGFGHSTRTKEIIRHLMDCGHQVKIFTYGQALFMLEKEFGHIVFEVPGLILNYKNNKLQYGKTILLNAQKIAKQAKHWNKISKVFADFQPDLVITDFEPITALLAKTNKKPLISIDNQHQLTNTKIKLAKKFLKELLADQIVIKSMVWGAKYYLLTSFYETQPKDKKTFWFPPIIRQEILDLKPTNQDYILVYEGADFGNTIKQFKHLNYNFVVFNASREEQDDNITYKKFSTDEWLKYLAGAKAVISTAGLSLICESIYLQKPYLALPIQGQIEQIINGIYLEKMGFGKTLDKFQITDFKKFISEEKNYRHNLSQAEACGNKKMFDKLDSVIKEIIKNS